MTLSRLLNDKSLATQADSDTCIKEVLVDTDILVAISKTDDSNHSKALKLCESLQKKGVEFILSPFTLYEAATVISYKISHAKAIGFVKEMKEIDLPVYSLSPEHLELAEKWFFKQKGRGISYIDCYNMALMERYKSQLDGIFSFDEIYKKNGFKTLF